MSRNGHVLRVHRRSRAEGLEAKHSEAEKYRVKLLNWH